MTTKHTEGPWRVQDCPHAYGDIEVLLGDDFRIYIPLVATDWSPEKKLRMKACAHLLAAAPKLLAAAEHAAMSEHHPACEHTHAQRPCTCHVGKARIAVAEATAPT